MKTLEEQREQRNLNTGVSWIALIIAVIALFFGVTAFNRSGTNVITYFQEGAEEVVETAEQIEARTEARLRLIALRTELAAEEIDEEVAEEIIDIRRDLATAYRDASGEVKEQWREVDQNLEQLESEIRNDTANALETLEVAIENLQHNLRTDKN